LVSRIFDLPDTILRDHLNLSGEKQRSKPAAIEESTALWRKKSQAIIRWKRAL
jgi:hypothetical protein